MNYKNKLILFLFLLLTSCTSEKNVEIAISQKEDTLVVKYFNHTGKDIYFLNYLQLCFELNSSSGSQQFLTEGNCLDLDFLEVEGSQNIVLKETLVTCYKSILSKLGFTTDNLLLGNYTNEQKANLYFVNLNKKACITYHYKLNGKQIGTFKVSTPYDYLQNDGEVMLKRIHALKEMSKCKDVSNYQLYLGKFYQEDRILKIE